MFSRESLEQLFHAVIAAGIVLATVQAEEAAKDSLAWKILIYIAVVAAFVLIGSVFDSVRRRRLNRESKEPLQLENAGDVNGYWVDVMRDVRDNKVQGGSFIEITSTGDGFEINGDSFEYSAPGDPAAFLRKGGFTARGQPRDGNSIYYHFFGEHNPAGDQGAGFYEFWGKEKGKAQHLSGAFVGAQARLARHVSGIRKAKEECLLDGLSPAHRLERKRKLTREYVDEQLKNETTTP